MLRELKAKAAETAIASTRMIVSEYANVRVEMDEQQLEGMLSILRSNAKPTTDEIRVLSCVAYMATWWASILADVLVEYRRRHPGLFDADFPDI